MDLRDTSTKVILVVVVVFVGVIIAGAVLWSSQPASTSTTTTVDTSGLKTDGVPFIGQANAPVTILEWSDYQCPLCKQFELGALPQLVTDYVNTGKVKIVFEDLAFLGNDSITAGEYELSIWKLYPSQYFAWRTAMYNAQDQEGDVGFGNAASIDKLDATIAGIDAAKVTADVNANASAYLATINADKNEAENGLKITGTPTFIIGNQLIQGVQPYSVFQAAIDPLLTK
jgi:protein-disulfide isomerase